MAKYLQCAMSATLMVGFCAAAQDTGDLPIEELIIVGHRDTRIIDVTEAFSIAPDPAMLLHSAPGANVTTNGPITGIPQYRGLFGPRIAVSLDGNQLASAGPNWMDPPISYAVTAQLESLEVYRGIAPVSIAQETIGGVIDARTRRMEFGDSSEFLSEGRVIGSAQSVNSGYQFDAELQLANDRHRIRAAAMLQEADDQAFPGGEILPSSYERARYDLGYGFRSGRHTFQLDYGYNDTGEAGTPALPMDIDYVDGDLLGASYRFDGSDGLEIEARIYASHLEHGMTNFHLRGAPASPALWRQNIASTDNVGFKLEALWPSDSGQWRSGVDGFRETHQSDIDNPNNPMFFVVNFNEAEREVYGIYLEHDRMLSSRLSLDLGARANRVSTDSGEVDGTPAMMMPPAQALRDAFNAADRSRSETNLDVLAKLNYRYSEDTQFYLGLAQKQRGPTYQERYLWIPLEATAGLADGQLYLGNIGLGSERATQLELGWDWSTDRLSLHPRFFYYRIDDYIQGTPVDPGAPGARFVRMMNASNGVNRDDPLQYSNVEAQLYGFDMDWHWRISDSLALSGLLNVVRGERTDIDDELYRIAPPNLTVGIDYLSGAWNARLESVAYAAQNDVSATNREQKTAGYATVNLHAAWQVTGSLQLALGVDNLFDRQFAPHLSGYNRAMNPDVGMLERLPAPGANVFGRVLYQF
jgi:iron complex outermembrane receptor protein